jgi:uncharacterized protein (TIGR03663 family)
MEADITTDELRAADDALGRWKDDGSAVAPLPAAPAALGALDRVIPVAGTGTWIALGWVATIAVALALRLPRLSDSALGAGEAARAYHAWALFRGQPPVGEAVPDTGPLLLLLQGLAFFLFGTTDVIARLVPVLAGLALVALPLALRRWVGTPAALGMAALAAFSPTLVYASRVVSPEIVIAALALGAVACLARLGDGERDRGARGPAVALGIVTGAAFAAGPSAITVAITLIVAIATAALSSPGGTVRRGLAALSRRDALPAFILAALATAILAFTRILSDPAALAGVGETVGAWWQLLAGTSSGQPAQLFLLALVIYEPLALTFAVVALWPSPPTPSPRAEGTRVGEGNLANAEALGDPPSPSALGEPGTREVGGGEGKLRASRRSLFATATVGDDAIPFFTAWAIAAFAIWSFSADRGPEHAVHVALPLVMLAGIGIGRLMRDVAWANVWHGRGGLLVLAMLGLVIGLAAVGVLMSRVDDQGGGLAAAAPPVAVLCLVVVPLAYQIWRVSDEERRQAGYAISQPGRMALLVLALLLAAFGLRSATMLAFYRTNLGTELLAQHTATLGTLDSIQRFYHLARDVGVNDGSARDPTGSHGLSIALEREVAWPYVWYFREFPDLTLVEPGAGAASGAQVVIAANDAGMAQAGYSVESWPWLTETPPAYLQPDLGAIARAVLNPTRWLDVWRYLLFRTGVDVPPPTTVAVGLTPELAGRVTPATGPFNLSDRAGAGTEPGQFKDPIGVAVGPDGAIAVVDSGNARVQRFTASGDFLGVWGGDASGVSFTRTTNGLGPTGITVAPDGTTWVADTWGHRVVALDPNGAVVRTIGAETIDLGDDPSRVGEGGGRFFGPRDVAITADAIYVVDTGNERIQQFRPDGMFVRAFGGYGTAPGELIEPVGIAVGPNGNLYVADSGNARIAIFTPEGEPVAQWRVDDWPPSAPGGLPPAYQPYLAFDAAGNLYATASNAGEILQLGPNGGILQRITQAGPDRLAQPIGVAVEPDGKVLIADVGRDAVLEYTPPAPAASSGLDIGNAGASPIP